MTTDVLVLPERLRIGDVIEHPVWLGQLGQVQALRVDALGVVFAEVLTLIGPGRVALARSPWVLDHVAIHVVHRVCDAEGD